MPKETLTALLWLIPAMLLSTTGELFLKRGMNDVGTLDFTQIQMLVPTFVKMATNPFIWLGFVGFMGGSVFWLSVISRVPLSLAYPMLGLGYLIVALESFIFLGERFHPLLLVGALTVGAGVAMIGLSAAK